MYQAWYLAGYAAAQKSKAHRLGYVAGAVTPEEVRAINAFTRGAQRFDPHVVVEVRWLGAWFDSGPPDAKGRYKEERLAQELMANGCDVIANDADNGGVIAAVEQAQSGVVSIGSNSPDVCQRGPSTCLGATYWNWGPLYVRGPRRSTGAAQMTASPCTIRRRRMQRPRPL
jgi:basic membrane lipoprotein Med (substrate-binding protein (PBP1-ABC) superfamily)